MHYDFRKYFNFSNLHLSFLHSNTLFSTYYFWLCLSVGPYGIGFEVCPLLGFLHSIFRTLTGLGRHYCMHSHYVTKKTTTFAVNVIKKSSKRHWILSSLLLLLRLDMDTALSAFSNIFKIPGIFGSVWYSLCKVLKHSLVFTAKWYPLVFVFLLNLDVFTCMCAFLSPPHIWSSGHRFWMW